MKMSLLSRDVQIGCGEATGTSTSWNLSVSVLTIIEGSEIALCYQASNISDIFVCKSSLMTDICLVCPIKRHTAGASWKGQDNETIFKGEVRLQDLSVKVSVNNCSSQNYSLLIHAVDFTVEGTYTCYKNEDVRVSRFLIRIQVVILTCFHPTDLCSQNIFKGLALSFQCNILNARRPFELIWTVNGNVENTSDFSGQPDSSAEIVNESSYFNHTFTGNEVSIGCQIDGPYVAQRSEYLNFQPEEKAIPFMTVILDGRANITFFELSRNITVQVLCKVSSEKLPLVVSWEVDDQEQFSERFQDTHHAPLQIDLSFTPFKEIQNITCVCKGTRIYERRHTITIHLSQTSSNHIFYITSASVAAVLVFLLLFLCVMKTTSSLRESCRRCLHRTYGDIYCMPDACEQLSRYVYLRTQLSGEGRLDRWLGELSGVSYHRKSCVGSTCAGPTFIYTEFVENGNLQSFLTSQKLENDVPTCTEIDLLKFCHDVTGALAYLKTLKLCHPLIRCRKVLLTKWKTCKIYDIQLYPVNQDILTKIVSKRTNSLSIWMAPETQERMEHTYLCDSWSLGVFIWEVYSWGIDPTYSGIPYSPHNHEKLTRPEKCPNYIYAILLSCWEVNASKRPTLEKIQKNLLNIEGQSKPKLPSFFGGGKLKLYENVSQ
ncbi:Fibroblast growth factor receptor 3 [Holothuria leucospilota]|uniref:Fibroblast growth factor receptor 3 n=1 Tax=Holothuria leucospilota TaxID=206669 RepID=A0A9Q1BXW0_HOLLE|nr:Fibroblast growth factor receptor 3 [Holothuria leucospilota]